jgi:thiosulfate/3-mercaptopyruvate sulfurtransferase
MSAVPPLITVDELAELVPDVRLCDIRWDLADPAKGRSTYEMGHIPGAVFVDLDRDLAAPPGPGGRHPLPDSSTFASTLGRLGIEPSTRVVVYDDLSGRIAARMWWMLSSMGHGLVQVLDGGYQAWVATGLDVGVGTETPETTRYPTSQGFDGVVTHDQLDGRAIVDARAGERYRGEIEPVDPRPGHIPGAVNVDTARNLGADGRFLDARSLAAVYDGIPDVAVVSCGSGVTACHDALAMVLAGRAMPDIYIGSYSEWSGLGLPVKTGPSP